MKPQGLPDIDLAWWQQEPNPCGRCKHSFYSATDTELRYLRCSRGQYAQQCRYERHETGDCGPDAKFWKEQGVS